VIVSFQRLTLLQIIQNYRVPTRVPTKLSSPPLLRYVSTEHIISVRTSGSISDWDMRDFSCHTQLVERCVKLITEAAGKVVR